MTVGEIGYAVRSLRTGRRRFGLGVLSVGLTLWLMVTSAVIFNSVQAGLIAEATSSIDYDLLVGRDPSALDSDLYFPASTVEAAIEPEAGVTGVYPALAHPVANAVRVANASAPIPGESNATVASLFALSPSYRAGRVVHLDGRYAFGGDDAVVSRELARSLRLQLGDPLILTVYRITTLAAAVNLSAGGNSTAIETHTLTLHIAGIVATRGRFPAGASRYVLTDLPTGQALYNTTEVNAVVATLDRSLYDPDDLSAPADRAFSLGRRVAGRLGPEFSVLAPKGSLLAAATETTRSTAVFSYLFAAFFPGISGVLIASVLSLSVEEKARDLATMRLLGARRKRIAKVVLIELGVILAIGTPPGILLGVLAPYGLTRYVPSGTIHIDPATVAAQVLIALTVTAIFALGPLRAALRTDPIAALRSTRSEGEYRMVKVGGINHTLTIAAFLLFLALVYATFVVPWVIAFAFTTLFFLLFLFSIYLVLASLSITLVGLVPYIEDAIVRLVGSLPPLRRIARLTRTNLRRSVRRNVSTNVLFALTVAMMVFFATYIAAVEENGRRGLEYGVGADIRASTLAGFSSFEVDTVPDIPGVAAFAAVTAPLDSLTSDLVTARFGDIRLYGVDGDVAGATFVTGRNFRSGDPTAFGRLASGGIILSGAAAQLLHVEVGDTVVVRVQLVRLFLPVTGILRTMPGYPLEVREQILGAQPPAAFIGLPTYETLSGLPRRQVAFQDVFVHLLPGATPEKTRAPLAEAFGRQPGFAIVATQELLAQSQSLSVQVGEASFVVSVLLILVAVFSLLANLYASVQERRFEIGVLRAIGLRSSGVAASIMLEGTSIAIGSLVVGIVAGIAVAWFLLLVLNIYIPIEFTLVLPVVSLALLGGVTAVAALAGSRFPAQEAARQDLQALLRQLGS